MSGDGAGNYLDGLPPEQAAELARVNKPGLAALRDYLASGAAVAFLGAGVSAPLYPLWAGLIADLVEAASDRLDDREAATCRALAASSPEEVVEIVRARLGAAVYREVLRKILRVRTDPETGRSWTPVQELVCRCAFKAVVTTNYDPGITDARIRVRPGTAGEHLTAAATRLRDGDYLIELAVTLADLAGCARAQGDRAAAERHVDEAITIASPRGMAPAHSAALAARARIRAGQAAITADPDLLCQCRDAADAALRLAVRHHLAWRELDALRAHADLDQAEGTDYGWAARAGALHARLVPPGLDPDPLATVERLVAAERTTEDGQH